MEGDLRDTDNLLTTEDVARILHLHVGTVQRLARDGVIRAVKLGRQYRIKRRWLEEYIEHDGESDDQEV